MVEYIDVTIAPGSNLATVAHMIRSGFGHRNSPFVVEVVTDDERWFEVYVLVDNKKRNEKRILRVSISTEPFGEYHLIGTDTQEAFVEVDSEGNIWVKVPDTDNEQELLVVATELCGLMASGLLLSVAT